MTAERRPCACRALTEPELFAAYRVEPEREQRVLDLNDRAAAIRAEYAKRSVLDELRLTKRRLAVSGR